jgi:hypothetical protein
VLRASTIVESRVHAKGGIPNCDSGSSGAVGRGAEGCALISAAAQSKAIEQREVYATRCRALLLP